MFEETRSVGVIVEVSHDEKGIIWPKSIAPYQAHLIVLGSKFTVHGEEIYSKLQQAGIEVLYDDREDISAGEKFADADLIGIPVRLVVSEKVGKGKVEWKERSKKKFEVLPQEEVVKRCTFMVP